MDSSELEDRAEAIIRARMARLIIPRSQREIDARTAFALAECGIITRPLPNSLRAVVQMGIADPNHEARRSALEEPLLILDLSDDAPDLIELEQCLLNPSSLVRTAVLDELQRKLLAAPTLCGEGTKRIIELHRSSAAGTDDSSYRASCIAIHDAIVDDVQFNIALLKQACHLGIGARVPLYLSRLLRPTSSGLEQLASVPFIKCQTQFAALPSRLTSIIEVSATEKELLDQYYDCCGYLPLLGEHSLGAVLTRWLTHTEATIEWKQIWEWAEARNSPFARYHACQAILRCQHCAGPDDLNIITAAFCETLQSSGASSGWDFRTALARHYARYLSCQFPDADTERISMSAWWLADRIADSIEAGSEECQAYCAEKVEEVSSACQRIWMLVRPSGQASPLYAATIHMNSLWSHSLAGELASSLSAKAPAFLLPEAIGMFFQIALGGALVANDALRDCEPLKFSFQNDIRSFVTELNVALEGSEAQSVLQKILKAAALTESDEALTIALPALPNLDETSMNSVALALLLRSYAGTPPLKQMWDMFANADWRRAFANSASEDAVNRVCDAVVRWQPRVEQRERALVAHYFLIAADESRGKETICGTFVAFLIASCIEGGFTSAIERARANESSRMVIEQLSQWHDHIAHVISDAGPLSAARLRSAKQALAGIRTPPSDGVATGRDGS